MPNGRPLRMGAPHFPWRRATSALAGVLGTLIAASCGDGNDPGAAVAGSPAAEPSADPVSPARTEPAAAGSPGVAFEAEGITGKPLRPRSAASGGTRFAPVPPAASGLDFEHRFEPDHPIGFLYRSGMACSGVAIGDVDGDDRPDILFGGGAGPNALYRNTGGDDGFRFEDVTAGTDGLDGGDRWAGGVAIADVNRDGRPDLYICYYDAPNQLFINQGNGPDGVVTFREEAEAWGVDIVDACHSPAFCDYDNDGDLDLYVLTNRYEDTRGYKGNDAYVLVDGRPVIKPEYEKFYVAWFEGPDNWGVRAYGREDHLLRNDGGRFSDVTTEAGISGRGDGNSATWCDFNDDGRMDLYVGNDFISPDHLYLNRGDGTFVDVIAQSVPHSSWFSMGADHADVNNDGFEDFLVADMSATNHFKQKTTMGVMGGAILDTANNSRPPQYMRNAFYIGTGTPRFLEAGFLAGVESTDWTWSIKFGDLDNDGLQDLFVTNGTPSAMNDSDYTLTSEQLREKHEWEYLKHLPPRHDRNLALHNQGDFRFVDVSDDWGLGHVGASYSAALADFDRDGDLDLVVSNVGEPASLYRNGTPGDPGNSLLIRLAGTRSDVSGIGARVEVVTPSGRQSRQLTLSSGYMSANEPRVHFGLGTDETVDALTVRWPSGAVQEFAGLKAGFHYTITEPSTATPGRPAAEPVEPMFAWNRELRLPRHSEIPFDDFSRQLLLPNKLSQLGPGLAWADVDGDGDDDFFQSGGAGQPGLPGINDGRGGLAPGAMDAFAADAGREDMGAVFLDADADGDEDLYVVRGSYQFDVGADELRDRLFLNDGTGVFSAAPEGAIPVMGESGGPVAAGDFDRDGDLDLFVGARVVPGEYPLGPRSALLRNDGGRFTDATEASGPGLAEAGLVTGAVWSDADGDGWVDLLVTVEWGPVRVFLNRSGTLEDATAAAGTADVTGWWNSIAAVDADNDGDMDYAVGNVGLNTKYHASPRKPAQLFYGAYEEGGRMNIVEAEFEDDTLYPIRGRSCSSNAMPHLREKFTSFKAFAAASLQEIYTEQSLANAHRFEVTTLESGIFINQGDATFEWHPFARLAQIAPVFGIAATDVDGDGNQDLYLAQNFFGPQPETGRFDGGMSQLLLGDGKGGFEVVWPRESGLIVAGDATALATVDFDGDNWPDFFVAMNNDTPAVMMNRNRRLAAADGRRMLAIRLRGKPGNLAAAGARATVTLDDGTTRTLEYHSGEGYLTQSPPVRFVGLRSGQRVSSIDVRWPDGSTGTFADPVLPDTGPLVLAQEP